MISKEDVLRLKEQRNAVILAHYYTRPEVQQVADFVGDSLALSQAAAQTRAEVILFAGVHFMAETAKILSPGKIVLLPDPQAGCSLAESCPAADFEAFVKAHPGHKVVTYVNTTASVKALTDCCCTSSNALRVVESLAADQPLIFAPDRNLGAYIIKQTGRKNIVLWDGACHVHEGFSSRAVAALQEAHPAARVLAHPECPAEVLALADIVGSTAALLEYARTDAAQEYIVVTEPGILYEMQKNAPGKRFIPVPKKEGGCNECEYMKLPTLENIHRALSDMNPRIEVDADVATAARRAIEAMLKL